MDPIEEAAGADQLSLDETSLSPGSRISRAVRLCRALHIDPRRAGHGSDHDLIRTIDLSDPCKPGLDDLNAQAIARRPDIVRPNLGHRDGDTVMMEVPP